MNFSKAIVFLFIVSLLGCQKETNSIKVPDNTKAFSIEAHGKSFMFTPETLEHVLHDNTIKHVLVVNKEQEVVQEYKKR